MTVRRPTLVILHLKYRKESADQRYRRLSHAINLRRNVSWPALHWYMAEDRSRRYTAQRRAIA